MSWYYQPRDTASDPQDITVGTAEATAEALAVKVERAILIGTASASAAALPVVVEVGISIGTAEAIATALGVSVERGILVGTAIATAEALAVGQDVAITIGTASATAEALAVTVEEGEDPDPDPDPEPEPATPSGAGGFDAAIYRLLHSTPAAARRLVATLELAHAIRPTAAVARALVATPAASRLVISTARHTNQEGLMADVYITPTRIVLTCTYEKPAGRAFDPRVVEVTVKKPNGTQTVYRMGRDAALTRSVIGSYALEVLIDVAGTWHYLWSSSSPGQEDGVAGTFTAQTAAQALA